MYDIYCRLRDDKKLKDSDVAKATGITKSTFSDWKTGRSKPKQDKLQKIADFFGVTLDYLMNGTYDNQINTIAAHHDEAEWTEEELDKFRKDPNYFVSLQGTVYKNDKEYMFPKMQRIQKERRDHYKYLNWEAQGKLMMEIDRLIKIREDEKKENDKKMVG